MWQIVRLGSVLPLTHFSTWRGADPIQRVRIRVLGKGFGVLRCDAEISAEEVECSGGVTCNIMPIILDYNHSL